LRQVVVDWKGLRQEGYSDVARQLETVDKLEAERTLQDRDPLATREFREILRASGTKSIRLPARSLHLNSVAG
jgi:hypothetical protein